MTDIRLRGLFQNAMHLHVNFDADLTMESERQKSLDVVADGIKQTDGVM